jgi:hypothetical protein
MDFASCRVRGSVIRSLLLGALALSVAHCGGSGDDADLFGTPGASGTGGAAGGSAGSAGQPAGGASGAAGTGGASGGSGAASGGGGTTGGGASGKAGAGNAGAGGTAAGAGGQGGTTQAGGKAGEGGAGQNQGGAGSAGTPQGGAGTNQGGAGTSQGGAEQGGAGQSQGGAGTSQGGAEQGGAGNGQSGAGNGQGGEAQGGAGTSQGGAGQAQGGAGTSAGGAGTSQGGAGQAQGGAGTSQGGAGTGQGGAGTGQGGAGTGQGGAGTSQGDPCTDSLLDGDETDIDCGGSCKACTYSHHCSVAADCISGVCQGEVCQPRLLFSEVRSRGSNGGTDEFVELFNPSEEPIKFDKDWSFKSRATSSSNCAGAALSERFNGAQNNKTIPPHATMLWVNPSSSSLKDYDDGVPEDGGFSTGFQDGGSVGLYYKGAVTDAVCFYYDDSTKNVLLTCATPYLCEGEPVSNFPHKNDNEGNVDMSLTRQKGPTPGSLIDTNNNATDFVMQASSPRNLAAGPLP